MVITNAPSSPAENASEDAVMVMRGISWPTYQAIMSEVDDNRIWRIAYDQNIWSANRCAPVQTAIARHTNSKLSTRFFKQVR
ncbi:MAG: hypothetical protein AAF152_09670 [Cyanobacteria bacterium P01_A01_bin.114]